MKLHQQRVCEEREALDRKRKKLSLFFETEAFRILALEERLRMRNQAQIMTDYSDILKERIDAFPRG